jgi:ferritin-like metal-binding protein YciE
MHDDAQSRVTTHLQDAYAMEENVLRMLDSLIANTDDGYTLSLLQNHRAETVEHAQRVEARLKQLGASTSMTKTATAMAGAMFKSAVDMVRGEKACKNLRDAFLTEHGEIAGYELLERYAIRANDMETLAVARRNKADEVAMAQRLNGLWDRAVDQDLGVAQMATA